VVKAGGGSDMGTARGVKTRNNKQWTEARYRGFIRSALRGAWQRWGPNHEVKKTARVERGKYRCAGYNRRSHIVTASITVEGKRKNNIFTDHIVPVGGDGDWNEIIENLFCEVDNLQLLCKSCHDVKTKDERHDSRTRARIKAYGDSTKT